MRPESGLARASHKPEPEAGRWQPMQGLAKARACFAAAVLALQASPRQQLQQPRKLWTLVLQLQELLAQAFAGLQLHLIPDLQ